VKLKIVLRGVKEARKKTREELALAQHATAAALYVAGNVVMTNAKQRAPLDTGVLRASGFVTQPIPGKNPRVEVGFGGAAEAYAIVQHERTEFRHEVGEAKFLEKAFNEVDVTGIVRSETARRIRSGDDELDAGEHREEPE